MRELKKNEIDAADRWQSYCNGWTDGAKRSYMNIVFIQHTKDKISKAYMEGYKDGTKARDKALDKARKQYRYKPSILRRSK